MASGEGLMNAEGLGTASSRAFISFIVHRVHSIVALMTSKPPPLSAVLVSTVTSAAFKVLRPMPVIVATPPDALAVCLVKPRDGRRAGRGVVFSSGRLFKVDLHRMHLDR